MVSPGAAERLHIEHGEVFYASAVRLVDAVAVHVVCKSKSGHYAISRKSKDGKQ